MTAKQKGRSRLSEVKRGKARRKQGAGQKTSKSREKADGSCTALAPTPVVSVTPAEYAIINQLREKQHRQPAPPIKVATVDGKRRLTVDHQNSWVGIHLLMNALGTTSVDFLDGLLQQLMPLCSYGEMTNEDLLNFMLAMVKGIGPHDETEAVLAVQMAAIHSATMAEARVLMGAQGPGRDLACTRLNKLARTFAAQIEALKKHRSSGEQTIKVQHVTVNDGGQAIVGNVAPGGSGVIAKSGEQAHALGHAPSAAVRSKDETGRLLPGAGGQGEEPLPDARRQVNGSAQG